MVRDGSDRDYERGDDEVELDSEGPRRVAPGKLSRTAQLAMSRRAMAAAARSSAESLPADIAEGFGESLDTDVSQVRVHSDASAAEAARSVSAKAFAAGDDIYFGEGHYQPDSDSGRELIAHEVAHTVQQRGAASPGPHSTISEPGSALESQADALARDMVAGRRTQVAISSGGGIARSPEDAAGGDQAETEDDSGAWTEQSIRELVRQSPTEVWSQIASRDTANGIAVMHRLALFHPTVRRIPSGAACPQELRQAMYRIISSGALPAGDVRGFFNARFGISYSRVFSAEPGNEGTDEQNAEFRGDVDFDVLQRVWWQLDRLPDADVSENAGMRFFRMVQEGMPDHALGTQNQDTRVVTLDEDGAYEEDPDESASVEGIVRHEVGHAVYDRMGGRAEAWVRDVARSTFEEVSEQAVRNIITAYGGFPATFHHESGDVAFSTELQNELVAAVVAYLGNPTTNFIAFDGQLRSASWAMPEGCLPSFNKVSVQNIMGRSADLAGFRHSFSAHYGKLIHNGPMVANMITATGRSYAGKAPYEFFAECYVEYYADPASVNDASLRGGSLPADIKGWFDANVAPPTAADLSRQPETGGASADGGGAT